jgi:hypothetical protein
MAIGLLSLSLLKRRGSVLALHKPKAHEVQTFLALSEPSSFLCGTEDHSHVQLLSLGDGNSW